MCQRESLKGIKKYFELNEKKIQHIKFVRRS